ncbi:MAG: ISLre2 family transposase [Chloroflexi bacterium]|nr:ISLre2 family transposase [Chloroflexota bacterium]
MAPTLRVNQSGTEGQNVTALWDWEEEYYRSACAMVSQEAKQWLETLDAKLLSKKPEGLQVVGFRSRTLVTRFGDVTVSRRMYRQADGMTRFLLDETMGWPSGQAASPSITESIVRLASKMPFRETEQTVSALTAGVVSAMTVHRLLQEAGKVAIEEEEERWKACYEEGKQVCEGQESRQVLYTEADGVWIHLQQEEERKHYEIKSGVVYEGWERIPGASEERYRLVGKRVYCHVNERMPFWEGASLEWGKTYDLSKLKLVVLGGDGANWIEAGTEEFASAAFQLDGFHLKRACGQAFGGENGRRIYEAIRSGEAELAKQLIAEGGMAESSAYVQKAREYVETNIGKGRDWRVGRDEIPKGARGLGTMESNGDKLTANRMKKRGMSWTVSGAHRMAKVIQLERNGELSTICRPRMSHQMPSPQLHRRRTLNETHGNTIGEWLRAGVPALAGRENSSPLVTALREVVHQRHLLN